MIGPLLALGSALTWGVEAAGGAGGEELSHVGLPVPWRAEGTGYDLERTCKCMLLERSKKFVRTIFLTYRLRTLSS